MRLLTPTMLPFALVAAVGVSPAAQAFDLTGHWTGKWRCAGFDGGKFKSNDTTSTLAVSQSGDAIAAIIDDSTYLYNGIAIPQADRPDKGEVVLLACPTANTVGPEEGEIVRGAVKTKSGTVKAAFKGTSIYVFDAPEVGTCKYTFKRIDTDDPGIAPCP